MPEASSSDNRQSLLLILDLFLSLFVFAPLVVAGWRGIWQLMDHYLYKDNLEASVWASTVIGIGPSVLFDIFQNQIKKAVSYENNHKTYILVSRAYTAVYCVVSVNHWRGVWIGWDVYTGSSCLSAIVSTVVGLVLIAILRGVRNLIAPPHTVVPDYHKEYFTIPNLYSTKQSDGKYFYMDVYTSVVVVASLVVFVWRGIWVFEDRVLFPDNPLYSGWGSAVIGLLVTVVTFVAQPFLQRLDVFRSTGLRKIIAEDLFYIVCLIGTLNVWRAVWVLLNVLFLPDNILLSSWITSIVGLCGLIILQNGNSIIVRGTNMDGKLEGPEGITLSTAYLRFFFKEPESSTIPEEENMVTIVHEEKCKSEEENLKSNGLPS